MCEHEAKYCPRCQSKFECKAGSIFLCQCINISLTESERIYLGSLYDDCLCLSCLKEVKEEFHSNMFKQKLKTLGLTN